MATKVHMSYVPDRATGKLALKLVIDRNGAETIGWFLNEHRAYVEANGHRVTTEQYSETYLQTLFEAMTGASSGQWEYWIDKCRNVTARRK